MSKYNLTIPSCQYSFSRAARLLWSLVRLPPHSKIWIHPWLYYQNGASFCTVPNDCIYLYLLSTNTKENLILFRDKKLSNL